MEKQAQRPAMRRPDPDEVMKVAFELQDRDRVAAEREERASGLAKAGEELGLDPEYLARAEEVIREREGARRAQAEARQRTAALAAAALVGLVAIGAGVAWWIPDPIEPWVDDFGAGASAWRLETSAGTEAAVTWTEDGTRGTVAEIAVQRFGADGRHVANLESEAHPSFSGAERVSFAARGEGLKNVRLYLENDTERWRGPSVALGPDWSTHTLDLRSFERQQRIGGEWKVVGWSPPASVDTVSFKLGWFVNDASQTGTAWIDDLGVK